MLNRITGLDGLRGLAVLAVLIYHAELGFLPGGFLGVDIFFVLSGFLITSILIQEINQTGRIDRATFYLRRIRRLMPALFVMLLFVVVVVGFWVNDAAYPVRRDLPWALTFVLNWSYIFFDESYFVSISRPPLLQHLWSLSIEEQFYVIWPIVLIGLASLKLIGARLRFVIFSVAVIGAIASTIWMAYLSIKNGYPTPNDPSRVYFGTDTHSMGLLIGCAAAALWSPTKFSRVLTHDRRNVLNLISLSAFAGLLYYLFFVTEFDQALYIYGFALVSLFTAIVVILATHPGLRIGKLLSFKPLVWLGDRSYGIYIWHWPIFMLLRPGIDVSWSENLNTVIRFVLVLLIADLSYRFVEIPIRNGIIGRKLENWKQSGIPRPKFIQLVSLIAALTLIFTSAIGMYRAPAANAQNVIGFDGITSIDQDPTGAPAAPSPSPTPEATISIPPDADAPEPTQEQITIAKYPLAIFGDSVVLSAVNPLTETLGDIAIDAEIGRQPAEIAERIELRRSEQRLGTDVVIHMGSNGLITKKDLEPILQDLSDRRRVVVVNVQVPRKWKKQSNEMINELVPLYPNVRLADWAAVSSGKRKFFAPDGVHLTKRGGRALAELIQATLNAP